MLTDVAGNEIVKELIQSIEFGLTRKTHIGKLPWNSILLYGPPGVGKTLLVRAICNELGKKLAFTCFWASLSDLTSKYIGESERLLKSLFSLAKDRGPAVIVFDEMDSLIRKRSGTENETERRMKTEFMRQMDTLEQVLLIGTTNMPWELDLAALKRFQRRVLVPMPDAGSRKEILYMRLGDAWECTESELNSLVEMTAGYSGSDLEIACNEAIIRAVKATEGAKFYRREGVYEHEYWVPCSQADPGAVGKEEADFIASGGRVGKVTIKELRDSFQNCRPTVLEEKLQLYSTFLQKYGLQEQSMQAPTRMLDYFC